MALQQNQRSKKQAAQTTNGSNRQSYDRDAPVDVHQREKIDYLTASEVEQLIRGAKQSRNPERDQLLILMLFRHGYRESEAIMARREWVDFNKAVLWVERLKSGMSRYHPIVGDELRLLRRYLRTRDDNLPWLFISERNGPLSDRSVRAIIASAAKAAKLRHVHPHMLRHSCGFYLLEKGHDSRVIQEYLGHASIRSTAIYTRLTGKAFEGLWR